MTAALLGGALVTHATSALADEGGVPFWFSGQYAAFAAVPPSPGASLVVMPYFYNGDASASKSFERGDSVSAGIETTFAMLLAMPGYAFNGTLLGGQPFLGLGFGIGYNHTSADISTSPRGLELNVADDKVGGTDLYPMGTLSWKVGDLSNVMVYLTGDIPVGAYDDKRIANIGIGHAAIDVGGGYTFFDEKMGFEFSGVAGLTFNFENPHTDYTNGLDSHVDASVSQFLSNHWQVGVVSYLYLQLSNDTYDTSGVVGQLRADALGGFRSDVLGVGPQVGYAFNIGKRPAYLNARAYWEVWAQNRVQGYALFGTVSIPLGGS